MPYWKDPESGIIYREADNPLEAYSPEEWQEMLAMKRAAIATLEQLLAALPKPDINWPPEAVQVLNDYLAKVVKKETMESRLAAMQAELAELEIL